MSCEKGQPALFEETLPSPEKPLLCYIDTYAGYEIPLCHRYVATSMLSREVQPVVWLCERPEGEFLGYGLQGDAAVLAYVDRTPLYYHAVVGGRLHIRRGQIEDYLRDGGFELPGDPGPPSWVKR